MRTGRLRQDKVLDDIVHGSLSPLIRTGAIGFDMKMPLIFDEHGDVSVYWSLKEARASIEGIDVKNNEYVAYDSTGRRLSLEVVGSHTLRIGVSEDSVLHVHDLVVALRRYIAARQYLSNLETLSLPELIQAIETKKIKD